MPRRRLVAALSSIAVVTAMALAGPASALHGASPTPSPADAVTPRHSGVSAGSHATAGGDKVRPSLADATGQVTAFVQLDTPSALDVTQAGKGVAAADAAKTQVQEVAAAVVPQQLTARSLRTAAPQRVAVTSGVVAGMIVTGDADQVRALASDAKVTAVYRIVPKTATNKGADEFTRALEAWRSTGATGAGVKVGIIDTGLDYTHADFGGPGTAAAYATAYGTDGTGPVPAGTFDPKKFLGGHDFAGPTYNANTPGSLPVPDDNPIDSPHTAGGGHGTHVAGTTAGYGIQADGTTFTGDYSTLSDLSGWKVGPGTAPNAELYSLKVFGDDGGSTNLVIPALEWAADPNGDGDFNDHLNVINMSLGSDSTPADDPENLFVDRLSSLGVLSVIASGNAGDITDVGGGPGNAASSLTVANSLSNTQTFDAIEVTAASDHTLVGSHPAQNSQSYAGGTDVTAPVAFLGDKVDGCSSLATDASRLAGKIAYLWWDDDDTTRACGSATRFSNAQAAGAVGVLLGTQQPIFAAGIAGNAGIPGAQLTAASLSALLPEITAGTLSAHIGPSFANATFLKDPAAADLLAPSSSRGVHGSLGVVKPDVAAPGTSIASAASSSGTGVLSLTGTSMATPHVTGIAALVAQSHPGWSPAEIKAAVMNTATHDVYPELNQSGPVYGPERVGSGRVDAADAVSDHVLAYASANPDLVSVTFGVVQVGAGTVTMRKTVTVKNTGTAPVTYTTSYSGATTAGGATITTSPRTITVPAGASRLVTVTLTADPTSLRKDLDPTSTPAYFNGTLPRDHVATVSGRLVLTPPSGSTLRVPVQAAPKLVSAVSASPVAFTDPAATTAPLELTGRGVNSGGWTSLVAPFQLVATSPQLESSAGPTMTSPSAVAAGDLRYVGFSSTAPQVAAGGGDPATGLIGIGIATQGEWASLGASTSFVIDTDTNGDGVLDLRTFVGKYSSTFDFTDVETYSLVAQPGGGYALGSLLDLWPVNGLDGSTDTTVFDNNVVVVPMTIGAVGITPGEKPTFSVRSVSSYAADPSGVVDTAPAFTADPFSPSFSFGSSPSLWYVGAADRSIAVTRSAGATSGQLLVLHSHNTTGSRAQVVDVTVPARTPTTTTLAVTGTPRAGSPLTLTATVSPTSATGTVAFREANVTDPLASAPVVDGVARATVRLGAGAHDLTAVLTPDSAVFSGSSSVAVHVDVSKARSRTSLTVAPSHGSFGSSATATVVVRTDPGTAAPAGSAVPVTILDGTRTVATGVLVPGADPTSATATIALPADLGLGAHPLTATYPGTVDVEPSISRTTTYRVTEARPIVTVVPPTGPVAWGSRPTVTVTVTGPAGAPVPTGKVVVLIDGWRYAGSAGLRPDGSASVVLPRLLWSTTVQAVYLGGGPYRSATSLPARIAVR